MNILEKDIEQLIWDGYHKDPATLKDKGLELKGKMFRQVNLLDYGIIDLMVVELVRSASGKSKYINIEILELKKDAIDVTAVMQAYRYVTGIQNLFLYEYDLENHMTEISVSVIGNTFNSNGDFPFFVNNKSYDLNLYTYSLDFEHGLRFDQVSTNWRKTNARPVKLERSIVKDLIKNKRTSIPPQYTEATTNG